MSQVYLCGQKSQNYKVVKQLGKGASGTVFLCQSTADNQYYAIKKVSSNFKSERETTNKLITISKGKKLNHVVQFHELFEQMGDNYNFYIVMEYCNSTTLLDDIEHKIQEEKEKKNGFPYNEAFSIGYQIAKGIYELKNLGIIHRDIKPENIIGHKQNERDRDDQKIYKICDLGISKISESSQTTNIGTPYYIAPEMIHSSHWQSKYQDYDDKVDVWALGLVIYEMITGQIFFQGMSLFQVTDLINKTQQNEIDKKVNDLKDIPPEYKKLLQQMIQIDRKERHNIEKVLENLENIKSQRKRQIKIIEDSPQIEKIKNYPENYANKSPMNQQQLQPTQQQQGSYGLNTQLFNVNSYKNETYPIQQYSQQQIQNQQKQSIQKQQQFQIKQDEQEQKKIKDQQQITQFFQEKFKSEYFLEKFKKMNQGQYGKIQLVNFRIYMEEELKKLNQ